MRLNISAWAIRNPVSPIVLFALLLLLGILSFRQLPVTRFPNIDIPAIIVTVTQSGAAPTELESQVTKVVEDAVANLTGVKHIVSTLTDGSSVTLIEFRLDVDGDRALNEVKDAISKVRADLPRTIDEPIVSRLEVESQVIQSYAASSPGLTLEQLSWFVDDVVKRELQGLKGVGKVDRYGGVAREIRIELDPDRLLALGISPADVNRQLRQTNVDVGSGRGEVGGQEQSIRVLAGARSVASLAETTIVLPGGRDVRLKDLGRVFDDASEARSSARLNGEPVVGFGVFRAKGQSELTVARGVEAKIKELATRYPDIVVSKIDDTVAYTIGNYEAAMATLIEGAALAVLVVLLFLRNLRATLICAVALPLAAIPTFWAMSAMGFSLNLVSLLGITLATGVLVDDAIVEIENIVRHMKMGKSPYRAALEAADEIGLAVIAITLTIVAIFAPVSFMAGVAGQYFKQFGLTVAVAVLFSLLVARLITPMMAAYLMRPVTHAEPKDGWVMRAYTRFLSATLKARYLTLVVGMGFFFGSIYATSLLPTSFIPDEDTSRIVMAVELPPGTRLAETETAGQEMLGKLKAIPEVRDVFFLGGSSPTGSREVRNAALYVLLVPKSERTKSQKVLKQDISVALAEVADVRAWYVNDRGQRELSYALLARDGEALNRVAGSVEGALRKVPGFANVVAKGAVDRPEIRVVPRLDEAADLGVSPEAIAETIRVATIGDVGANLAKFNAGDRLVPIRVQLVETARGDLERLSTLKVTSATGRSVPLASVADITFSRGPAAIERYDRERRVEIGADLAPGYPLGPARQAFEATVVAQKLPAGVRLQAGGDAEVQDEVATGFMTAMGTGLLMVLGLLMLLFGSVLQPITILLSLPLSFGGVVVGLLATNNPVSMPVYIGLLMLMGIVTKNAIMLVDFAVERIAAGEERNVAMIDAGRKRARPIVMTTLAMAAGMLPSAYALGDGGEFRAPMAIAVIGGLLVSTVLSLVFVPSFFVVMDDLSWLLGRIFSPLVGPRDEPEAEPMGATDHHPGAAPAIAARSQPQPVPRQRPPIAAE